MSEEYIDYSSNKHKEITRHNSFTLVIGSHYFIIKNPNSRILRLLYLFSLKFIVDDSYPTFGNPNNRFKKKIDPVIFGNKIEDDSEFRFHIGQLSIFKNFISNNGVTEGTYETINIPLYTPADIDISLLPKWELRDYQIKAMNFSLEEEKTYNKSRFISLPTGTGKTVTSMAIAGQLKKRIVICILPAYIDKWHKDVLELTNVKEEEICIIQGSPSLIKLLEETQTNEVSYKVYIISLRTLQVFYKKYEESKVNLNELGYVCNPEEMYNLLDIGLIIIDEAHRHLHSVYKLLIYSNVPKVLALSATFISDSSMIEKMQKVMFPMEIRFNDIKMKKYIKVYSISYRFKDMDGSKIVTTERGSRSYSHNAFEKSLIRDKGTLYGYLRLINSIINKGFNQNYIEGDKLIIFASSVKMCTIITDFLANFYPHYDVRRYVEKDPYENIIEPDIRVTTVLSGGTAIDIPNLRMSIMTSSILSKVSNLQALGRLRELKDRDVKFFYIYSEQIYKQVLFHKNKMLIFEDRVKSIKEFSTSMLV